MKIRITKIAWRCYLLSILLSIDLSAQPQAAHDLAFNKLATRWDEAIPLGNGMLGALIWQREGNLRFSLDRADLWDLRPMEGLHRPEFRYDWILQQVKKQDYKPVQQYFDEPYEHWPAPSKIPGGALEFAIENLGEVKAVRLDIAKAICKVDWKSGTSLTTFVHAEKPIGWFLFEGVDENFEPTLIAPKYEGTSTGPGGSVAGDDLSRLGYKQGTMTKLSGELIYRQAGWNGFEYEISIRWRRLGKTTLEGLWSISAHDPHKLKSSTASDVTRQNFNSNFKTDYSSHMDWWKNFWSKSSIKIPDALIEKQWYLETYKFGSAARKGAPPISLQAVWTADNGKLPPWKGDYHHDLNTQLSYWPCYSGNHLEEGLNYFDHLENNKPNYIRYTKEFFNKPGLAVPGVTTLDGTEMGGWIQYSLSPTVSAWLAHHYYLQWRYSMDKDFLKQQAYPLLKETATFLEAVTIKDENGFRKLVYSTSPEINDNALSAWFPENSNYDLALMKFVFNASAELAHELNLADDEARWNKIAGEFNDFSLSKNNVLKFAPSLEFNQSHRHFSNAMAIYPLGLIKWEDGERSQTIIRNTLHAMDSIGPDWWTGYSYSWLANLKARAKNGEGAAKALEIFAKAFCSINSFHVNGDQTHSGYSKYTYRPFTLEGNFAFAAGLQEMLIQSYAGFIEIMPAIPADWKNVSFKNLRTEGACLVSATREKGSITQVVLMAEEEGTIKLKLPFEKYTLTPKGTSKTVRDGNFLLVQLKAKDKIVLRKID